MGTYGQALTATDYAAGLRALADALEEYGLPASSRHPEQPLTTNFFVESVAAVKDFAATHDLPVNVSGNHTSATIALGPNPNTSYPGSVELSVVHIDKSDETEPVEEPTPETYTADEYVCPEDSCTFVVAAAGPLSADMDDDFVDEREQHRERHLRDEEHRQVDAEPVGALTAPPGVELVPPPGMTPEARDELADRFASIAARAPIQDSRIGSPAGIATLEFSHPAPAIAPSALVQLDAIEETAQGVLDAAEAWLDASDGDDVGEVMRLADAVRAFRKAASR